MKKKSGTISISQLADYQKDSYKQAPLAGVEGVEMTIRETLPLREMLQFVADVVASCFEEESGDYIPEMREFAIKAHLLTSYANFHLPANIEKQYQYIYQLEQRLQVSQQIIAQINQAQYREILAAIEERIQYQIATAAQQSQAVLSKLSDYLQQSQALFGEMNGADLAALAQNLAALPQMDETTLVQAVLAAEKKQEAVQESTPTLSHDQVVKTEENHDGLR